MILDRKKFYELKEAFKSCVSDTKLPSGVILSDMDIDYITDYFCNHFEENYEVKEML